MDFPCRRSMEHALFSKSSNDTRNSCVWHSSAFCDDSGKIVGNDSGISKVGSAVLRRTLFLIMTVILKTQPQDEPVFQFMNKKRSEGKPYKVYMMASANKFLRIYYARVKAVMDSKHSK